MFLAHLLEEQHGLVAIPEQILRSPFAPGIDMPDIIVDFRGLRLAIEAEFETTPNAEREAYEKALRRVERGIAHVGMAVVYPGSLREPEDTSDALRAALARARLRFTVVTESTTILAQLQILPEARPLPPFIRGVLADLAESLRRSYEQLIQDEVLERAVELLGTSTEGFLASLATQPATTDRFAQTLDIRHLPRARTRREELKQREAINRIAALILTNALVFQEVLAKTNGRVLPLHRLREARDLVGGLAQHWRFILDEINYHPIFEIAQQLISSLAADRNVELAIASLIDAAFQIVNWQAPLRHDLAGRIFHRHLEGAKYLGARYTKISSAAFLLKLSLPLDSLAGDWTSVDAISALRIADLACGTGTLLMAASESVIDNYLRACSFRSQKQEVNSVHTVIIRDIIHGFDVLQSAVHLTASTLALRVPDVPINVTNLSRLPYGGIDRRLGSLEFLESREITGLLFSRPERVAGVREEGMQHRVVLPDLDLCVMNPPFTSSRQPNLLFGTEPPDERRHMRARLRDVVRRRHVPASITAGLGAVFAALGDKYLKPGGRLSLVLPHSVLLGVAWKRTRELLSRNYHTEYIIVSHEPEHWNFSENTNFGEALLVARKLRLGEELSGRTIFVNLWKQPRNAIEGLSLARSVIDASAPDIQAGQGAAQLTINGAKYGEALSLPAIALRDDLWAFPTAFAQAELVRAFYFLRRGQLYLPGEGIRGSPPVCSLGNLGNLGPDPRDVYDGFEPTDRRTAYPALWGHDASRITKMSQSPNRYLEPLAERRPGRNLRRATDLWPKAARVLIAQRPRLNTKSVVAVLLDEKVLGDVWWPFALRQGVRDTTVFEKALVLWLNSTLGLIVYLAHREETEGAWVQFKKPVLMQMPVLDMERLEVSQVAQLAQAFDRLSVQSLQPFPRIEADPVRSEIDLVLRQVLHLPDSSLFRQLLAREPSICLTLDRLI